jgi:hypothetical protein
MSEEFEEAVNEARRLERKVLEYAPYSGEISIEKTIDLEPKEYIDLTYPDLLNLYERTQKIISTVGLGILVSGKVSESKSKTETVLESEKVETRLREITDEVLKTAEEVGKEPITFEKEIEIRQESQKARTDEETARAKENEIEFETKPAMEIELERELQPPRATPPIPNQQRQQLQTELSIEKEESTKPEVPVVDTIPPNSQTSEDKLSQKSEEPRKTIEAGTPKVEVPVERRVVVAAVPPALRESPDKAATKRYEQMEEQIKTAIGEMADETTLKKKMLELTKQLFKEKSSSKREELKLQITVLKNMLAGAKVTASKPRAKMAKQTTDGNTHVKLFETMLGTQQTELSQTKDSIIDSYNKQIAAIKKKFYEDLTATEELARRKQIFEAFVFSMTSLVEQLPEVLNKYREFTIKKHMAELEKLQESLSLDEKSTRTSVEERIEYVKTKYAQEFAAVKGIIGKELENLIEVAGSEIFKKSEGEALEEPESRVYGVMREINETDEGTLLYFLHSKDPEYYKKYERKHIAKAEAIFKAKELMAKEKGLSEEIVKKYFSHLEG